MSKARVRSAVYSYQDGRIDEAAAALRDLDRGFVEKRLRYLVQVAGIAPEDANILWRAAYGTQEPLLAAEVDSPFPSEAPEVGAASEDTTQPIEAIRIEDPRPFLEWLQTLNGHLATLDETRVAHIWGLVALGALSRPDHRIVRVAEPDLGNAASRFARSVGLYDLVEGRSGEIEGEPRRTVRLHQLTEYPAIEPSASEISRLIAPDADQMQVRLTLKYVIVELLRNVLQHSHDKLGAVVAAQRMDHQASTAIQVAVADGGIGIFQALAGMHPGIVDARVALQRSLWPHFSGAFEEGGTGTSINAGLGLFFISEMAKLTGGRMVLATRGATLVLSGNPSNPEDHTLSFLEPVGLGYPGTLVVFELPQTGALDYNELIETIRARAQERVPRKAVNRWLSFDEPPSNATRFMVDIASEDTPHAERFAREHIIPRVLEREAIVLDFRGLDICTQSFAHALLYDAVRLAWATRTRIYIAHAEPAVMSGLRLLENYALGG